MPSITRPLWGASSRVTSSSPPVTGSRVISGFTGPPPLVWAPLWAPLRISSCPRLRSHSLFPLILLGEFVILDAIIAQSDPLTRRQVAVAKTLHLAHEGGIYPVVVHLDQLVWRRPSEAERPHLAHVEIGR